MKITWLGHSGFRIEIGDAVLLVDPWLSGNPMFPAERRGEAIQGATHILLSHGHGDHIGDAAAISRELGIPAVAIPELAHYIASQSGVEAIDFNKGGTVDLAGAKVTMVNATHSSSFTVDDVPVYLGTESGYMIAGEGHVIYFSGDTDVMADMALFAELHQPDIGILASGGHYTMDMERATFAARKFFDFKTIIPCHYRTFPLLEQSAEKMKTGLPGVNIIEPEVLEAIMI